MTNPLLDLEKYGQSVWLDFISRSFIENKELSQLIKQDHVKGVTSNPSIFEKSIAKTNDYDQSIAKLCATTAKSAKDLYESLVVKDIQDACDVLLDTYKAAQGKDGFACLEVSPHLAFDTQETIKEAHRLFARVDRPNCMIKVPGTPQGMPAIRSLIRDGINVNVTLLFSVHAYYDAAMAYLLGLKDRNDAGLPINSIHSVASFFISRIDSKIDALLEKVTASSDQKMAKKAKEKLGTIAIANAQSAYRSFQEIYHGHLAKELISKGASPQRLLWASTSTKNKDYSDVLYVESLIGKNTVNTMPLETLLAFKDHGNVSDLFATSINEETLKGLSELGIDFKAQCQDLLQEGVKLFVDSFDHLMAVMDKKFADAANHNKN